MVFISKYVRVTVISANPYFLKFAEIARMIGGGGGRFAPPPPTS